MARIGLEWPTTTLRGSGWPNRTRGNEDGGGIAQLRFQPTRVHQHAMHGTAPPAPCTRWVS